MCTAPSTTRTLPSASMHAARVCRLVIPPSTHSCDVGFLNRNSCFGAPSSTYWMARFRGLGRRRRPNAWSRISKRICNCGLGIDFLDAVSSGAGVSCGGRRQRIDHASGSTAAFVATRCLAPARRAGTRGPNGSAAPRTSRREADAGRQGCRRRCQTGDRGGRIGCEIGTCRG
jgi:hypothetical protein